MKVELNRKQVKFEPIDVKITIENEDELFCLLAALNTTHNVRRESFQSIEFKDGEVKEYNVKGDTDVVLWNNICKPLLEIYDK